ncbi:MAG: hypothetical protein ABIK28_08525 [Planctomycetota bacterium]
MFPAQCGKKEKIIQNVCAHFSIIQQATRFMGTADMGCHLVEQIRFLQLRFEDESNGLELRPVQPSSRPGDLGIGD